MKGEFHMKIRFPDYSDSIMNLSNSILQYFGAKNYHEGLSDLNALLEEKQYKHVVLMVNDGLGYENIQELLPEDSFLRQHLVRPISSIFPPTTTAATTALQSGLSASQHGWMGWNVLVPQVDDVVTLFLRRGKSSGTFYSPDPAKTHLTYDNLYNKIPRETGVAAYGISPHEINKYDFNEPQRLYEMIEEFASKDEKNYIYAYYDQPDGLMHMNGTQSQVVKDKVAYIDEQLRILSTKLKDTLIIVTADHGLVDVENLYLEDYPELVELLSSETSIEPRAVNFFIKDGKKEVFESKFNQHFADKFKLMSKAEVLESGLFGDFESHPNFKIALGDYLAVATDRFTLLDTRQDPSFKAHHAGLTQREMLVPLILIDCK